MQNKKINQYEGSGMRGHATLTQYKGIKDQAMLLDLHQGKKKFPDGIILVDKKNLIVDVGKINMAHLLGNDPDAGAITHMAFGGTVTAGDTTTGTAPDSNQYKLDNEIFREPVIYTYDDGAPNFSVTFTAAALANEHPAVDRIFEIGLTTNPIDPAAVAGDLDLFSRLSFPPIFFDASAPVSMGLVVDWEILFEVI
tara:strand:+ start:3655 stop:4242 length:588 start_codon:yes stop_codon:yes gene_type:complete